MSHYDADLLNRLLSCGNHDTIGWLSGIINAAQLVLQQGDNLNDEQRKWLRFIANNAAQCHRLSIVKMRTLTNITSDISNAPCEHITLSDIITDVIASLNGGIEYGGQRVVIEIQIDPSLPSIWANRRRLYSCLHIIMSEFHDTTTDNPGHVQLIAKSTAIQVTMQPRETINTDHAEMFTLLLTHNDAQAITIHQQTLQFVLGGEQIDHSQ
jgi:nitrogen-specific signal transduction histidine kinase